MIAVDGQEKFIDDAPIDEQSGILSGIRNALLPVFAVCLMKSRDVVQNAPQNEILLDSSRLDAFGIGEPTHRLSHSTGSGTAISADIQGEHLTETCLRRFRSVVSKVVLWGDAVHSADAEATSIHAPWLFQASIQLLAECARDALSLLDLLSGHDLDSPTDNEEATLLKTWLERAMYIGDADTGLAQPSIRDHSVRPLSTSLASSFSITIESLETTTELLMELLPSIEHVQNHDDDGAMDEPHPTLSLKVSRPAWKWIDQVASKYKNAPQNLIERLGEANWQRFCRLRIAEDDSLAVELGQATSIFRAPLSGRVTDAFAKSIGHTRSFIDSAYGTAVGMDNAHENQSTTSHSSYASAATDDPHHFNSVPLEPPAAATGKPFVCCICDSIIGGVRSRNEWKYVGAKLANIR